MKLTDLDYLSSDHHLQMMKAALPYVSASEQKAISIFVKISELTHTMKLFDSEEISMLGICSLEGEQPTAVNMLSTIKPFGNPREQDMIERFSTMIRSAGKPPLEQIKALLSPEQQSRLENIQLIMQMLQQAT